MLKLKNNWLILFEGGDLIAIFFHTPLIDTLHLKQKWIQYVDKKRICESNRIIYWAY